MIGRMTPPRPHWFHLFPGTGKHITIHGEGDFADVIRLPISNLKISLEDHLGEPTLITLHLKNRKLSPAGAEERQDRKLSGSKHENVSAHYCWLRIFVHVQGQRRASRA